MVTVVVLVLCFVCLGSFASPTGVFHFEWCYIFFGLCVFDFLVSFCDLWLNKSFHLNIYCLMFLFWCNMLVYCQIMSVLGVNVSWRLSLKYVLYVLA